MGTLAPARRYAVSAGLLAWLTATAWFAYATARYEIMVFRCVRGLHRRGPRPAGSDGLDRIVSPGPTPRARGDAANSVCDRGLHRASQPVGGGDPDAVGARRAGGRVYDPRRGGGPGKEFHVIRRRGLCLTCV